MKKYIYINGKIVNSDDAQISLKMEDFKEEMEYLKQLDSEKKKLYNIKAHLDRLKLGINYLDFKINKSDDELIKLMLEV